jgi:hypothetical protein
MKLFTWLTILANFWVRVRLLQSCIFILTKVVSVSTRVVQIEVNIKSTLVIHSKNVYLRLGDTQVISSSPVTSYWEKWPRHILLYTIWVSRNSKQFPHSQPQQS